MATTLLETLKTDLALMELEPGRGGCFEVSVDEELIYSKGETGRFPEEGELAKLLEA